MIFDGASFAKDKASCQDSSPENVYANKLNEWMLFTGVIYKFPNHRFLYLCVKFSRFLLDLVLVFLVAKLQPLIIALDVTTVGDKRFLQSSLKNCKARRQLLFLPATALRLEL